MNYSYERVSTKKQDERRQEISLEVYNIPKQNRYIDKCTGKNAERPKLQQLIIKAKNGDHIYCESISRLGRNVTDLRSLSENFINAGVVVHFVKEGFSTDGTTYKFLLTILGAVAEMERESIEERVQEGVEKAKKHGTKSGKPFGRPLATYPKDFNKYYDKWKSEEITGTEFANLLTTSRSTLYRFIRKFEGQRG